jgi:hypothetical protein
MVNMRISRVGKPFIRAPESHLFACRRQTRYLRAGKPFIRAPVRKITESIKPYTQVPESPVPISVPHGKQ